MLIDTDPDFHLDNIKLYHCNMFQAFFFNQTWVILIVKTNLEIVMFNCTLINTII
jgi:hypothetical protein